MTTLLLDTSALLYWTLDPTKLPTRARRAIEETTATGLAASAISLWEIGIKAQRGALDLGMPFDDYASRLRRVSSLVLLPIDADVLLRVVALPWEHRDPADRIIVATAESLDVPLVTSDGRIRAYYPRALWD